MINKTIILAGKTYTLKESHIPGGHFDTGKKVITVGTKLDKENRQEVLLHECIEAILTERNYRYKNFDDQDTSECMFVMNHKEFESFVRDLTIALKDYIII